MAGLDFKLFRGQRIRTGSGSDWVAYSITVTAGADIVLLPTDPVATAGQFVIRTGSDR